MHTKSLLDCLKLSGPLFQQMSSRSPLEGSGEGKQELGLQHWSLGRIPKRVVGGTFRNKDEAGTWDRSAGDMLALPRVGMRHRAAPMSVPVASTVPDTLIALEVTAPCSLSRGCFKDATILIGQ